MTPEEALARVRQLLSEAKLELEEHCICYDEDENWTLKFQIRSHPEEIGD